MRDVVESFVIGLAERVDGLQDGEMAGDFGAISRAAGELAAAAREAGYPSIVDAAERVATASAARAGDEARKGAGPTRGKATGKGAAAGARRKGGKRSRRQADARVRR